MRVRPAETLIRQRSCSHCNFQSTQSPREENHISLLSLSVFCCDRASDRRSFFRFPSVATICLPTSFTKLFLGYILPISPKHGNQSHFPPFESNPHLPGGEINRVFQLLPARSVWKSLLNLSDPGGATEPLQPGSPPLHTPLIPTRFSRPV